MYRCRAQLDSGSEKCASRGREHWSTQYPLFQLPCSQLCDEEVFLDVLRRLKRLSGRLKGLTSTWRRAQQAHSVPSLVGSPYPPSHATARMKDATFVCRQMHHGLQSQVGCFTLRTREQG